MRMRWGLRVEFDLFYPTQFPIIEKQIDEQQNARYVA
jgi:hypothetical protein